MADPDTGLLVEQALTAWRPRAAGDTILFHPAWSDLAPADRERVFEETLLARTLEAALDPLGLSTTSRTVVARILRGQLGGSPGS